MMPDINKLPAYPCKNCVRTNKAACTGYTGCIDYKTWFCATWDALRVYVKEKLEEKERNHDSE